MGRTDKRMISVKEYDDANVEAEVEAVEVMDHRPANIDADTWAVIQETGRVATEKLYDIIASPRFDRLKVTDKARLIAMAQDRAYGKVMPNKQEAGKGSVGRGDVVAGELNDLARRSRLPEYRMASPNTGTSILDVELDDDDS